MPRWSTRLILIGLLMLTTACSRPPESNSAKAAGDSANIDSSESTLQGKQPWSGESLSNWKVVFAEMQEVLDMSSDEKRQLEATFEQHVQKLQTWYQEHGQRIAEGDRIAIEAARNRDLARLRKIKQEIVPLKQEAMALHKTMDNAVLDALTETNRNRWQAHRLTSRFLELAESLELSDSQQTQVGELAIEAAKHVRNQATPQAAGFLELEKRVEAKVLDAEQRTKYEEIKAKNKMRSLKKYSSFQPTSS